MDLTWAQAYKCLAFQQDPRVEIGVLVPEQGGRANSGYNQPSLTNSSASIRGDTTLTP